MRIRYERLQKIIKEELIPEADEKTKGKKKEKTDAQKNIESTAHRYMCPRHKLPLEPEYGLVKTSKNEAGEEDRAAIALARSKEIATKHKGIQPPPAFNPELAATKNKSGSGMAHRTKWYICPLGMKDMDEEERESFVSYGIWTAKKDDEGVSRPYKKEVRCDYRVTAMMQYPGQKNLHVPFGIVAFEHNLAEPHDVYDKERNKQVRKYYGDGEASSGQVAPQTEQFSQVLASFSPDVSTLLSDEEEDLRETDPAAFDKLYKTRKEESLKKSRNDLIKKLSDPKVGYAPLLKMINDMETHKFHWKKVKASEAAEKVMASLKDFIEKSGKDDPKKKNPIRGVAIGQDDSGDQFIEIVTDLPPSSFAQLKKSGGFEVRVVKQPSGDATMFDPTSSNFMSRYKTQDTAKWIKLPLEFYNKSPLFTQDDIAFLSYEYPKFLQPVSFEKNNFDLSKRLQNLKNEKIESERRGVSKETLDMLNDAIGKAEDALRQLRRSAPPPEEKGKEKERTGYRISGSNIQALMFKLGWDMSSDRPEAKVKLSLGGSPKGAGSSFVATPAEKVSPHTHLNALQQKMVDSLMSTREELELLGMPTDGVDAKIDAIYARVSGVAPSSVRNELMQDEDDDELGLGVDEDDELDDKDEELEDLKKQRDYISSVDLDKYKYDPKKKTKEPKKPENSYDALMADFERKK